MVSYISKSIFNISRSNLLRKMSVVRSISLSASQSSKSLLYNDYGEPADVLKLIEVPDVKPASDQVTVKWLLAPVNPADINTIQGKYPSKPSLPAVPGNEGVGEITNVGASVKDFIVGDKVVPNDNHTGTWRSQANYLPDNLIKVPCIYF